MTQSFITLIVPFVLGALLSVVGMVLKNRRSLLQYQIFHNRIGTTTEDKTHGKVEVTVNGTTMDNLFFSQVRITNHSMSDLKELEFKIWVHDHCRLLTERTFIEGTIDSVQPTKQYTKLIEEDRNKEPPDLTFELTQRWYAVPSLNRGQTVQFEYLVNSAPGRDPYAVVQCQTAGVRIREKRSLPPIYELWGVPVAYAAWAGIPTALVAGYAAISNISTPWIAATTCLGIGLIANVPGALLIKTYIWIRSRVIG